jgi:putative peptidoglycan lipid II flippase
MDEEPTRGPGVRALISGAALLFGARLLTAALALVQVMLLATKFGASTSTDAYFVASAVALMFVGPIETALNMAFPPVFVHAAETDGPAAAWRIAAGLFRVGLLASGGMTLVLVVLSPWISALLAPGFEGAAVVQVAQIIRITAPLIFFAYAAAFLSSLEFIEGRSLLPASGMIVSAAAGPLALLWFADRYGVVSLAWGALGGAVVRCLLLIRFSQMRRLLGPSVTVRDPIMRRIGKMMVSRLVTTGLLEVNLLVDRVFASLLGPGFISALAYASRAVMTVVRLFMVPMARMLLPPLSRLAARERYDRMRGLIEKLVIAVAFLLVPLVAFTVGFRTELLGMVFGRGAFDATAVEATSEALLFYALGIIPFLVAPMLSAVFFSLQDSATPLRIGVICVLANAGLDAILILGLGHGGIALATSLVGGVRAFLLWIYLGRRIGELQARSVLGSLLVSGAAAVVAFWSARLFVSLAGPGWSDPLWRLAAYALIGGAGYLLLQNLFNRPVVRLIPAVLGRVGAERS